MDRVFKEAGVRELIARAEKAEAERNEARREYESQREYADDQYRKALAAEAEVEAADARHEKIWQRAKAAEAELAKLRAEVSR
jgi:uncharacterized membrane protein YqiK